MNAFRSFSNLGHKRLAAAVVIYIGGCSAATSEAPPPSNDATDASVSPSPAGSSSAVGTDAVPPPIGGDASVVAEASSPTPTGKSVSAVVRTGVAYDVTQGWCSAAYVPSLKRFLAIFVNHYSPAGYQNNSLRAFDPVTSTVEVIHPKNVPGAPRDRDNHQMLYNGNVNQMWVLSGPGGLVLDVAAAESNKATPPSYGAVGWTDDMSGAEFAAAASIRDWPSDFRKYNAVVDWSESLDTGVIWSGAAYTGGSTSNDLYVIRPNTRGGPERYMGVTVGNFDSVVPAGYDGPKHGRHNGRILGNTFYTLSLDRTTVTTNASGAHDVSVDLWTYDLSGPDSPSAFKKKAPLKFQAPPESTAYGMYFPCVTADTKANVLLAYLSTPPPNNLYAYLADRDEWVAVTVDQEAPLRSLAACDYSPDHNLHAYQDGNSSVSHGWSTIALTRSP